MSLYDLPDEILLIIFNYCNGHDLIQLSEVCKRFDCIASEFLMKKSNNLLITSQMSEKFRERCQPLLSSYREKFYIHSNWKRGRHECRIFYSKSVPDTRYLEGTYRNCLEMRKDVILFISDGNLCAYSRTKNGSVSYDDLIVANCIDIRDIFVPCNDIIVTYHSDGSIRQWTIESLDGKKYFNEKLLCPYKPKWHFPYVIDVTSQNIVIASNADEEITIWKYIPQENSITDKYVILDRNFDSSLELFFDFITFDITETKVAAGFSEKNDVLIIYDINKCCTEKKIRLKDLDYNLHYGFRNQILWKEPNNILFLYDDGIIKIDVRTDKVVQRWYAPLFKDYYNEDHNERLTCMSTDNQYAIMTGTSYGKLTLWDQRKSDFIQVYNDSNLCYVNCLQFDSSRMYVGADKLYEFDFTKIYSGVQKWPSSDILYSNLLKRKTIIF